MRIVHYRDKETGAPAWGWLRQDQIVPLQVQERADFDLTALFLQAQAAAGSASVGPDEGRAGSALADSSPAERQRGARQRLADAHLLAPLAPGATVYCVGINYRAHASEAARDLPAQPSLFLRRAASLVGSGQPLRRPAESEQFDFEGELALVIGKGGRRIAPAVALQHVAAYTCFNDGSVRDYQKHSVTAGKNFEASGACGPWLTSAETVADPGALHLRTTVNGEPMQSAHTSELIFPLAQLISYVSQFAQLRSGDVIATGTPQGVGAARNPPRWLVPGDRVVIEIGGVGMLENTVAAA